ncbi:hypothetical protein BYT27DRAFT_7212589 [Phlegmacium glaucopus]|nr:hypothetical protein BYT27DRAFT_7212589 [Phlegmacium glaucopus]
MIRSEKIHIRYRTRFRFGSGFSSVQNWGSVPNSVRSGSGSVLVPKPEPDLFHFGFGSVRSGFGTEVRFRHRKETAKPLRSSLSGLVGKIRHPNPPRSGSLKDPDSSNLASLLPKPSIRTHGIHQQVVVLQTNKKPTETQETLLDFYGFCISGVQK